MGLEDPRTAEPGWRASAPGDYNERISVLQAPRPEAFKVFVEVSFYNAVCVFSCRRVFSFRTSLHNRSRPCSVLGIILSLCRSSGYGCPGQPVRIRPHDYAGSSRSHALVVLCGRIERSGCNAVFQETGRWNAEPARAVRLFLCGHRFTFSTRRYGKWHPGCGFLCAV